MIYCLRGRSPSKCNTANTGELLIVHTLFKGTIALISLESVLPSTCMKVYLHESMLASNTLIWCHVSFWEIFNCIQFATVAMLGLHGTILRVNQVLINKSKINQVFTKMHIYINGFVKLLLYYKSIKYWLMTQNEARLTTKVTPKLTINN